MTTKMCNYLYKDCHTNVRTPYTNTCKKHSCVEKKCYETKSELSKYCKLHRCEYMHCGREKNHFNDDGSHMCKMADCVNLSVKDKPVSYCVDHVCKYKECVYVVNGGSGYCCLHKCHDKDCEFPIYSYVLHCKCYGCMIDDSVVNHDKIIINSFCKRHTCGYNDEKDENTIMCLHYRKNETEKCKQHTCAYEDCNKHVEYDSCCELHKCIIVGCNNLKINNLSCLDHTCWINGCINITYVNSHYCKRHQCLMPICHDKIHINNFCEKHNVYD